MVERASLTTVKIGPSVVVRAIPAYRLIISPQLADSPSRLLVLHTRVATYGDDALHFTPSGAHLRLRDDSRASVFDRPRAIALLHRTTPGAVDLSYLDASNGGHRRGGLSKEAQNEIKLLLIDSLLDDADFSRDHPLDGYLIVDTLHPLPSLDGAVLEVTANRVGDGTPVHHRFEFTTAARTEPLSTSDERGDEDPLPAGN